MKNKSFHFFVYILFFTLLIPSIYVNYLAHRSSIVQSIMTTDLNNNERSQEVLNYLPNFNTELPNLSFTAIPIKGLVSRYYRFQGDFETALSLLDESIDLNPYIMFNESEKAEVYDMLQVKDSFKYFAKKAFYGLPKNQRHWIQFSKAMKIDDDSLTLDQGFEIIKDSEDPFFTTAYLSSNIAMDRNSPHVINIAKNARNKFKNSEEVKLVSDYIIYGKKNVDSALGLAKEAENLFKTGVYDAASRAYISASLLNPGDYTHFENAGLSLIRIDKHSEAIPFFERVIDSLNPKNGKAEYLLASIYEVLGDLTKACALLDISTSYNFPLAYDARIKACTGSKD